MPRWPISNSAARAMYIGGRGNDTARRWARFWGRAIGASLLPRRWVNLEVRGRNTGRTTSFPIGMADVAGRWYLVSMLGECNWVANVRAANGDAVLRRRRARPVHLTEVPIDERGPILRRYVAVAPGGRPHIAVPKGATVEEFQAIAAQHPVFQVHDQSP